MPAALCLLAIGCQQDSDRDAIVATGPGVQLNVATVESLILARGRISDISALKTTVDELVRRRVLLAEARRRGLDKSREYRQQVDRLLLSLLRRDVRAHAKSPLAQASGAPQVVYRVRRLEVPDRALADQLYRTLRRAKDSEFADVVRRQGVRPRDKITGGDLGYLGAHSTHVPSNIFKAIQALAPGERVTSPMVSGTRWMLLRKVARQTTTPRHTRSPRQRPLAALLERLLKGQPIQIDEGRLRLLIGQANERR